jgi:hypothetical protein
VIAWRNAGELTFTSGRLVATTPMGALVGSAKLGTPWARTHLAKATRFARWDADSGGGGPVGVRYLLHAVSAFWNAGPLKEIPWTVSATLPGVLEMDRPSPPGPVVASGKLVTP